MQCYFARIDGCEPVLFEPIKRDDRVAVAIQRLGRPLDIVELKSVTVCDHDQSFCLCLNGKDGKHTVIDLDPQLYGPVVTRLVKGGAKVDFL